MTANGRKSSPTAPPTKPSGRKTATVAIVAAAHLLYQNTGYEQFGFRFSLDYMPYLIVLLALGRRPITRAFKAAIVAGIAVNAFGAVTFKRFTQFYTKEFFP